MSDHSAPDWKSVAAIVTYWLLAIWSLMIICVFQVIHDGIKIDGVLLAMVSGLIGTQTTLLVAAVSFWVGASVGGKTANAALAQLAGAGPPPPAEPKP